MFRSTQFTDGLSKLSVPPFVYAKYVNERQVNRVDSSDRQRLEQKQLLAEMGKELSLQELVVVYLNDDTDQHQRGVFCALIPNPFVEKSLSHPTWDMRIGDGGPGAVQYGLHNGGRVEYLRYGNTDGVEPLVLRRSFHGLREPYIEISEEFRLFHNLFYDPKSGRFCKFDDAGNPETIIVCEQKCVRIRLREIREFLAIKEMHLAIYFDSVEMSKQTLTELGLQEGGDDLRNDLMVYGVSNGDYRGLSERNSFSRVLGKRLVPPLPKEKSGFWGFCEPSPQRYVEFVIDIDERGDEVMHSSSEANLSNYFGANPGEPRYLTPVWFRKAVLDKYYQQAGKYSVEPGYLRCAGLWGIRIDNHHDEFIVAWLGDLGRDLPYEEQLHWRSHNIPPSGKVSETFFRQQILGEWVSTDRTDHLFKMEYESLVSKSTSDLGWPILLPLSKDDQHFLLALRVPATDEQREFDEVVLSLTKILVDSINEKKVAAWSGSNEIDQIKGSISRLEKAFTLRGVRDYAEHIKFLRDLQDMRSSGAAHRKGTGYQKIVEKLGVDHRSLRQVAEGLLVGALSFVRFLKVNLDSGVFGS